MSIIILRNRPDQWLLSAVVLFIFALSCFVAFRNAPGEDLGSSYVGCRLLATGQASHLYSYDPDTFDEISDDDVWEDVAFAGGYKAALHPYVQTPLWAFALQPLCRHTAWRGFFLFFALLSMLSLGGSVWLTAKYWAPSFFNPLALAIVVAIWVLSQPFQYAAHLMQTHILLIFLTLAGLILVEKEHWSVGALLVACAAAVKITPAFLVLYWLLTKQWKAAMAFIVWSVFLWGVTVLAVGHQLADTYLADLRRISEVLIIPMNNQSFAAWFMAHRYPVDEALGLQEFRMPTALRLLSTSLVVVFTLVGGWIDRKRSTSDQRSAPVGAMMAIVAATVFAPIAWTHYSVILVVPIMIVLNENVHLRSKLVTGLVVAIVLLNFRPIATDINHFQIGPLSIVRGQFYAWILTLVALGSVAFSAWRQPYADPSIQQGT